MSGGPVDTSGGQVDMAGRGAGGMSGGRVVERGPVDTSGGQVDTKRGRSGASGHRRVRGRVDRQGVVIGGA